MNNLNDLRHKIIEAAVGYPAHLPSAFSCLEIIRTLYDQIMKPDDVFILSKGHGCLALYAVLEAKGYDVHLSDYGTKLKGHPEAGNGILFSTGSLGHGLALGAGYALAKKIKGEGGRVFVLMGDGECQEGSVWEATRIIGRLKLNVICIVDANDTHPDHRLSDRFRGYLLPTYELGKDQKIFGTLDSPGPACVIVHTVKGCGCHIMEADPQAWHHRTMSAEDAQMLIAELST